MAVTRNGDTRDTITTNGDLYIGDTGTGSLVIDAGSTYAWHSTATAGTTVPAGQEPTLFVGSSAAATGSVTVTGVGSQLIMHSLGTAGGGVQARIGDNATGTVTGGVITTPGGSMDITAGGAFRIFDVLGAANIDTNQAGLDGFVIAQSGPNATPSNGSGRMTLNAGTAEVYGSGSYINVTRNGGTGELNVLNGSKIDLISRTTGGFDGSYLHVGRGGGKGTMLVDNSTVVVGVGAKTGAAADGSGGTYDPATAARGSANAFVALARDNGNGTLTLQNNAALKLYGGSNGAQLQLGAWSGPTSTNPGATVGAGTAVMNITNSSVLLDSNGGTASISVGRFQGANATLNMNAGAIVQVFADGGTGGANFLTGFANNDGTGGNAAQVGVSNINTGATLTMTFDGTSSGQRVGMVIGNVGTGTVNINGGVANFNTTNATTSAYTYIGFNGINAATGTGNLNISNGGIANYNGLSLGGNFEVGRGLGSTGNVSVTTGGILDLDGTTGQKMNLNIATAVNTTLGQVVVNGAGSIIRGAETVAVGSASLGAHGELGVINGGLLDANSVFVNNGGFLTINGGTVDANITLNNGGQIGDGINAIATSTITGNVTLNGGTVEIDIAAAGNDVINIGASSTNGGTPASGLLTINGGAIRFDAAGSGYQMAAGTQRTVLNVAGGIAGPVTLSTYTITGQHVDFGWLIGQLTGVATTYAIKALNSGATGGNAILDLGTASATPASFVYSTTTNVGQGSGGSAGLSFYGFNVDEVRGTSVGDTIEIQGAGVVAIDAGGGNDTVVYASINATSNVLGGSGTDTLLVIGGGTPTNFNLASHGFEQAEHRETDASGQPWTTRTTFYDASWQATSQTGLNDNGDTWQNYYTAGVLTTAITVDAGPNDQPYQQYQLNYNTSGVLLSVTGLNDDNSTFATSIDYLTNQPWASLTTTFAANSPTTAILQNGTMDNGDSWVSTYHANGQLSTYYYADTGPNDQPYQNYTNTYTNTGALVSTVGLNDSNQVFNTSYDYLGNQPWAQLTTTFQAGSQTIAVLQNGSMDADTGDSWVTTYHAGTNNIATYTYFDTGVDDKPYNYYVQTYDPAGTLLSTVFF